MIDKDKEDRYEVSLESFVEGCPSLKRIFEKAKRQNLVIKVNEIEQPGLPTHGYMLPIQTFDDYALVRKVIDEENFEVVGTFALHPYGSSKYYTLKKRPSDIKDILKK